MLHIVNLLLISVNAYQS